MACSKCKQKNKLKEEIENGTDFVSKATIWVFVIWSGFALYGIYSLISKLL